ncbi:MAG: hypothetical protein C0500_14725 [Sphingobium sp.]|nr:hypothetical protein [Sphingobium sp.]
MPGIPRPTERARALRRTATPAERMLWRQLSASKLGHKFSRQMPVGPYITDFMCRSKRLVIELDGYSHDLSVEQDRRRTAFIEARGFRILRFTNAAVFENIEGVVAAILLALEEAGVPTPQPPPASGRGSQ